MTLPSRRRGGGQWAAVRTLLPLLWPKGETAMRARVAVAIVCLLLAKAANILVPMLFKHFSDFESESARMSEQDLVFPAFDLALKCSHVFNLLDARGSISASERASYITGASIAVDGGTVKGLY